MGLITGTLLPKISNPACSWLICLLWTLVPRGHLNIFLALGGRPSPGRWIFPLTCLHVNLRMAWGSAGALGIRTLPGSVQGPCGTRGQPHAQQVALPVLSQVPLLRVMLRESWDAGIGNLG